METEKEIHFRKTVHENMQVLRSAGFKYSTLYSWFTGRRIPKEAQAKKISNALGVPLAAIPYWRIERV